MHQDFYSTSILLYPLFIPLKQLSKPKSRTSQICNFCCTRTTRGRFGLVIFFFFFFFLKSRFFSCFKCLFAQVCSYEFLETGNKKLARLSMNSVLWNAVSWHSRNSVISVPRARWCLLLLSKGCSGSIKFLIPVTLRECCELPACSCFPQRHKNVLWWSWVWCRSGESCWMDSKKASDSCLRLDLSIQIFLDFFLG